MKRKAVWIFHGVLFLALNRPSTAFVPGAFCGHSCSWRRMLSILKNDVNPSQEEAEEGSFDVESARKKLQSMLSDFSANSDENLEKSASIIDSATNSPMDIKVFLEKSKKTLIDTEYNATLEDFFPPAPPLSTIERDRRVAEIQLLESLALPPPDDSAALEALWDLWYSERGGQALGRLKQADQLMGDPTSWKDCETSLFQLIEEHGVYFVEPINRLATLFFLQGKFDESYLLCKLVLHVKPWHVGALSGIVQVCIGMDDREKARLWAAERLPSSVAGTSFPPFDANNGPQNPRRVQWVDSMVLAAKERLENFEETTKRSFGEPETYYNGINIETQNDGDITPSDDAWQ